MTVPADDDPITLKEACEIVFRNQCRVATLRAEAKRGRLTVFKIGRSYFTTLRNVREMVEMCRVINSPPQWPELSGVAAAKAALQDVIGQARLQRQADLLAADTSETEALPPASVGSSKS